MEVGILRGAPAEVRARRRHKQGKHNREANGDTRPSTQGGEESSAKKSPVMSDCDEAVSRETSTRTESTEVTRH